MSRSVLALLGLLLPLAALAQLPATGRLLVAAPTLTDPNFSATVILLVHHSDEGSLGVYLNRPTWIDGAEPFPALAGLDAGSRTLFLGGPVAMTQLLVLTGSDWEAETLNPILDGVQLTADLELVLETLQPTGAPLRLFAGHAEWTAGQLQTEVDNGLWRVVDGSAALVFTPDPERLWEFVNRLAESGLTAGVRTPRPFAAD